MRELRRGGNRWQSTRRWTVCIIGGGASGLVAAKELTEAGMTVCVLERGPWYKREDFALGDELTYKRRNFFWPTVELEPRTWRPNADTPAEILSTKTQTFSNAMCVGGGTIHYSGLSWRFHESDFRVKSRGRSGGGHHHRGLAHLLRRHGALLREGGMDRRHLGEGLVEPLRSAAQA